MLDWLAYNTNWKARLSERSEDTVRFAKSGLEFAKDAKDQYSILSFTSPRVGSLWTEAPEAEFYWVLGEAEVNPEKKYDLLRKSVENVAVLLKRAELSGYPAVIQQAQGNASRFLASLARAEPSPEAKRRLLGESMRHRDESMKLVFQLNPWDHWTQGFEKNNLASLEAEIAGLTKDPATKLSTLEKAVLDREAGLKLCLEQLAILGEKRAPLLTYQANWQYEQGVLLNRLYELTMQRVHLAKVPQAFRYAGEYFQKLGLSSRVAECYWKAAQAYQDLGEHLKAADYFLLAAENFNRSAEKIPQLKGLYDDHALYMQAWSEAEKAKYYHERQDFATAKESYDSAAALYRLTSQWGFLASNYSAWAQVENAEDLSRKDRCKDAAGAFQNAAELFAESKEGLHNKPSGAQGWEESRMIADLARVAGLRRDYCKARIALEEARILDREGDHGSSSEKYGQAAETLAGLVGEFKSEPDQAQQEFKLMLTLAKAWHRMAKAEADASPESYLESSRLFEEARELSPDEKGKMLAMGHSRFCRALEAGARYVDTRDASFHSAATQQLEIAANYYMKAGFQSASEYAYASKLLFDAYAHMDRANKESDQEKKARLFLMAEKVLQASADSFLHADYPARGAEVFELLKRVRREKELALSLMEVLQAPTIVSNTNAFAAPAPTFERAVGVERFEYADLQVRTIARRKTLKVGEDLHLELELVNAGRGPAQLIGLEGLIPEGFDLEENTEAYRVEDGKLNLKGRRLGALKAEELRLVLRPKVKGRFALKPRIFYTDDSGGNKSQEVEPVDIVVKELGISGWLKGPKAK